MGVVKIITVDGTVPIFPPINCSNGDSWTVVENRTLFPLWIQFNAAKPTQPPAPGNEPYWKYSVGPGNTMKMPVTKPFDGTVWVGTRLPVGAVAGIALEATISSYVEGEQPDVASAQPISLLAQERVVAIPAVPTLNVPLAAGVGWGTPGAFVEIGTVFSPAGGSWTSPTPFTLYVYHLQLTMIGLPWDEAYVTCGYVRLGPLYTLFTPLAKMRLIAGKPGPPTVACAPQTIQGSIAAGALRLSLFYVSVFPLTTQGTTSSLQLDGTALCSCDFSGQPSVPSVGLGATTLPGAVY